MNAAQDGTTSALLSRKGDGVGRTWSRIVAVCALLTGMVWAEEPELPIKGLRLPLEYFEDGRVKMQFSAGRARVPEGSGEVQAAEALVEQFDSAGQVVMRMEAETCRYNRETGEVHSKDAVRMERRDMEVTGVGMNWKASEQHLHLHAKVRVVLKGGGLGKVLPNRRKPNGEPSQ